MLLPRALLLVLASALVAVQGQTSPSSQSAPRSSGSQSQSQSQSQRPTLTTVTSTSFSVSQSFSGRTAVTVTVPVVVTFVPDGQDGGDAGPPVPPGNNGEQDAGNQTTVDTRTWPTAAKTREGGPGGGTNGAPLPGQDSPGGLYGPPDDYIAAGVRTAALSVGALLFGVAAVGLI